VGAQRLLRRTGFDHTGLVERVHEENIVMFNRRSLMVGGLAMAAAPSLARVAQAQVGRPTLVFVGHEL
jgi:hypothetical protein